MKLLTLCYVLPTISTVSYPPLSVPEQVTESGTVTSAAMSSTKLASVGVETEEVDAGSTAAPCAASSSSRQLPVETFNYKSLFTDGPTYCRSNGSHSISSSEEDSERMSKIDFSSPSCLSLLNVRPVSVMVRRLPAKGETYRSVGEMQQKYRSCSILKVPRQSIMAGTTAGVRSESSGGVSALMKKKRKKRRDHTELRTKQHTKHNKMWKSLMTPLAMPLTNPSRAVEESIARQAALGSARMNTAEAIQKREDRKIKIMARTDGGIHGSPDGTEYEEGDEREEEIKRIRSECHQNGGVIVKGTDSRKEMLAAAGRAAAIAAIAAAAAHQASFPSGRTIED